MAFSFREAAMEDAERIASLIALSVRELQVGDYSTAFVVESAEAAMVRLAVPLDEGESLTVIRMVKGG